MQFDIDAINDMFDPCDLMYITINREEKKLNTVKLGNNDYFVEYDDGGVYLTRVLKECAGCEKFDDLDEYSYCNEVCTVKVDTGDYTETYDIWDITDIFDCKELNKNETHMLCILLYLCYKQIKES